jgi:CHAT domain-containing protein
MHRFLFLTILTAGLTAVPTISAFAEEPALSQAQQHLNTGRYADALSAARQAELAFRDRDDVRGLTRALILQGQAGRELGDYIGSETAYTEARRIAEESGDREGSGLAYIGLAYLYDRKDHGRTILFFREALSRLDRPEDWPARLKALQGLGDVYVSLGQYDEAFQTYSQALESARQSGDAAAAAGQLDYLGYFHRTLGDFEAAASRHREALETAGRITNPVEKTRALARAYNHLGLSTAAMAALEDDPEDAEAALALLRKGATFEETALGYAVEAGDRYRQGYILRALADLNRKAAMLETDAARLSSLRAALAWSRRALSLGRAMGSTEWEGLALHHQALTWADLGYPDKAIAAFQQALAIWAGMGDIKFEAAARRFIGESLHERTGDWDQALREYGRAIELYDRLGSLDLVSEVHLRRGRVLENKADLSGAREAYWKSIEALEAMRVRLPTEEQKVVFFERRQGPYEALIRLLIRMENDAPGRGLAEEAFELSERARGRAILDLISEAGSRIKAGVDPETLNREADIQARTFRLRRAMAGTRNPSELNSLRREIEKLDLEYGRLMEEMRSRHPDYASLKNPKPLGFEEIRQRILPADAAFLEYFCGRDETWLFIVPAKGPLKVLTLAVGRSELADRIEVLREPFQKIKQIPNWNVLSEFDTDKAYELYRLLFQPAEPYIEGAARVIIAPDGPLFYLPFEMLISSPPPAAEGEEDYFSQMRKARFLVETAPPLSYAVSAGAMDPALRRESTQPAEGGLVAMGNPITEGREGYRIRFGGRDLELSPLREVARSFFPKAKAYTGAQATKARFLDEAPQAEILLLSTHGILNEKDPMFSALIFAPPPGETRGELLETHEIFNLVLRVDLATLSACEVGLGRIREGEGIMGLSRAMLFAGAKNLVVSLWSVDDRATARLVTSFHDFLRRDATHIPESLTKSKLRFIEESRQGGNESAIYIHPFFWAPFVLVEGVQSRGVE